MKKILFNGIILILLMAVASACGAPVPPEEQVYVIQTGTTLFKIQQSLAGSQGTYILQKGNDLLFLWNMRGQGIGFTLVNNSQSPYQALYNWEKATGGNSNLVNFTTAESLIEYFKSMGWRFVRATEIAEETSAKLLDALAVSAESLITIFVVPIGLFPQFDCPPGYYQCTDG